MKYLSKSRLLSFRQCPLRLWNEVHRRDLMQETDPGTQFHFDQGTMVGELAQARYPEGRLIEAEYWDFNSAQDQTVQLLNDSSIPALFEAAFIAERTRVRCDILIREDENTWTMWGVKSVLNPKDIHILDMGIQVEIAHRWANENNVDLNISKAGILHLNRDYIYAGGEYDLQELFKESDKTTEIVGCRSEIDSLINEGVDVIDSTEAPLVTPGAHCSDPYGCPFLGSTCEIPVRKELTFIPGIRSTAIQKLKLKGINGISDIDDDESTLNQNQLRAVRAWKSETTQVESSLKGELRKIGFPRYHLDFETFAPIIPRYSGTKPFQAIPFQFSIHLENSEKEVDHFEYLHNQDSDPRMPLALKLLDILEENNEAPILCYSSYEKRIITDLSNQFPSLSERLISLTDRLIDLLPLVRNNVYDKGFEGSFSIKYVLPALVPSLGYSDLDIADGTLASLKYLEMLELINIGKSDSIVDIEKIRIDLLLYCMRDTEAMVMLLKALNQLCKHI